MNFDLTGHVSVVTGGNGGIGLGIARGLVDAGASVAICGTSPDKTERAVKDLRASGGPAVLGVVCDVSDPEQVTALITRAADELGPIGSCFAVAGVNSQAASLDMELDEFRRIVQVNLEGTFLTFQAAARRMVASGGGSLVAISSISSRCGQPRSSHYAASKAGISALVKSFAVEWARHGIRVNAIVPGWIETDMLAPFMKSEKFQDAVMRRIPVRRWGGPADLAALAVYLACPGSGYHTGDELTVDGAYALF